MQSQVRVALDFPNNRHSAENRHYSDLEFFNRIGQKPLYIESKFIQLRALQPVNRSHSLLLPVAQKKIHQTSIWNTKKLSELAKDIVARAAVRTLSSIQNNIPSVQGNFSIMNFSFAQQQGDISKFSGQRFGGQEILSVHQLIMQV